MSERKVLPEEIDSKLWFACPDPDGGRDYLYDARWQTFPGRMAAYCPERQEGFRSYRISLGELPADLPLPTRYWVKGFLAGNLPPQPDADEGAAEFLAWERKAIDFSRTGEWPVDRLPGIDR